MLRHRKLPGRRETGPMSEIFHYAVDTDGIATITWDLPGASMNVLDERGIRELDAHVDAALADDGIRGVIITSAKKDFAGGMDLNVLARLREEAAQQGDPAEIIFGFVMQLHGVLRKIERAGADPKTLRGGKPFVWASPGTALGIGLEIGLACHRRIAADEPRAKIGLPEIMVGLFPGAGGTTRLVRMLGVMGAAPFLLEGKTPAPRKAKAAGLIDEVVPADDLLARAREWLLAAGEADAVKPWDRKGYRIPGGAPYTREGFEIFLGGVAMTHGRTQGAYPAPKALLSAVYEGALVDFDTALRIEARWFTNIMLDPSSEAMIRSLFVNKQALEKGARRPAGVPDMKVKKLGVLGAGMMGAGIGFVAARAGIEVVLIDRDEESAARGRAAIEKILDEGVKRGRITAADKETILDRVLATADYAALAGADLVVEAVFEDPGIKAEVIRLAEAELDEKAVFATNTSTLPISELARASRNPARFIGIHFFSPVHRMPLVEIIRGRETGEEAVARALDFARQLKKVPIVVNDARFFYANRCIIPYINEGLTMITEGVVPPLVENAARQLGFPVGPLQLVDETSLELGHRIARATRAALGGAYRPTGADALLEEMVKRGRLGRKAKAGIYEYDESGRRVRLWPGLAELWPPKPKGEQPPVEEVQNRLMMIQAIEAVHAFEEGVLMDIREGDVGAIMGWGFAPWSGGPFSWLDMIGARRAIEICDDFVARIGERFAAPGLLRELAERGDSFYGRFGSSAEAA